MSRKNRLLKFLRESTNLRIRDLLFMVIFAAAFYHAKNYILHLLILLNPTCQGSTKEYEIKKNIVTLQQENKELRDLLNLPACNNRKYIIGKVLTNIYSKTEFWVFVNCDTKKIKKNAKAWQMKTQNGRSIYNLIGFVSEVQENLIKIMPLTHKKTRLIVETKNHAKLLLQGNGSNLRVITKYDNEELPPQKVFLDEDIIAGFYKNNYVYTDSSYNLNFICIEISNDNISNDNISNDNIYENAYKNIQNNKEEDEYKI